MVKACSDDMMDSSKYLLANYSYMLIECVSACMFGHRVLDVFVGFSSLL